jgi:S-disulfanyl-L-cysteine oxidoreductase SoxD
MKPILSIVFGSLAMLGVGVSRASAQEGSLPATESGIIFRGAYTEAQARRGEGVFRKVCNECHESTEYSGPSFEKVWTGQTAFDLFELIRSTMPNDNPGRLKRQEYVEVVAYILSLNAYPPGKSALPSSDDGLRAVRLEAKR